jgi:hypothetical protein
MATTVYKLTSGSHSRWIGDKKTGYRKTYSTGDLIEDLTEDELNGSLKGRVQLIGPNLQSEPVNTQSVTKPVPELDESGPISNEEILAARSILSKPVSSIKFELDQITDPNDLALLEQVESEEGNRKGVHKLIQLRLAQLQLADQLADQ